MNWILYTEDELLRELWIHVRNISSVLILGTYLLILLLEPIQAFVFSKKTGCPFSEMIFTSTEKGSIKRLKIHFFLKIFLYWLSLTALLNFTFLIADFLSDMVYILTSLN
jgi:hypothetical protein